MNAGFDPQSTRRAIHHAVIERAICDDDDLEQHAIAVVRAFAPEADLAHQQEMVQACLDDVFGLGPFEDLLRDESVTEIMYNGAGRTFVERQGRITPVALPVDDEDVLRIAQRLLAALGLRIDRSAPIADARLGDGSRVHVIIPPLAPDGPCLTIRRFSASELDIEAFDVPEPVRSAVVRLVHSRANLLISGGTSSGKTTFLNALGASVPPGERIVTIEETAELRLRHPHVVRLETRPANGEGIGAVIMRDLVRAALRMRPDRIVVGEVRGAEALDMIQAANTGHAGSMSTVHANGSASALMRLEALALQGDVSMPLAAIRTHLRYAVDAVLHLERHAGSRRLAEIAVVEQSAGRLTTHLIATRTGGELHLCSDRPAGAAGVAA